MARIGNLIRNPEELQNRAKNLEKLSTMLDRITKKDIELAAQALKDCAEDIAYLLRGELIGCPCQRIDNDNHTHVVYEEKCLHHGRLLTQCAAFERHFKEAEKKLKDDVRRVAAIAALPSLASHLPMDPREAAARALEFADELVAAFLK